MSFPKYDSESNSDSQDTSYTAFLLRCWLEDMDSEPAWRFTLVQMGDTMSKRGFAYLEDVIAYLRDALIARKSI